MEVDFCTIAGAVPAAALRQFRCNQFHVYDAAARLDLQLRDVDGLIRLQLARVAQRCKEAVCLLD